MQGYKQVIAVRQDLKLSKGKLSVQVAHASLEAYKNAGQKARLAWDSSGCKKVAVRIEDLNALMGIYESAKRAKLPCALIKDAGRTEVEPGTITAVGIGPAEENDVDRITGRLKML